MLGLPLDPSSADATPFLQAIAVHLMHTLNKASQLMPEVYLVFLSQFEDARGGDCISLLHLVHQRPQHLVHQGPQRKDTMPGQA